MAKVVAEMVVEEEDFFRIDSANGSLFTRSNSNLLEHLIQAQLSIRFNPFSSSKSL